MRTCRLHTLVVALLFAAGTCGAANPGWESADSGLIADVGPRNDEIPGILGPVPSESVLQLQPLPGVHSGLLTDPLDELASPALPEVSGLPGGALNDGALNVIESETSHHWSTDPSRYTGARFADTSGIHLPAFDEIERMPMLLPTESESFFMEFVVFPTLAAALLVLIVAIFVIRIHRRRSRDRVRVLLHA